jgi:hypothetical protein
VRAPASYCSGSRPVSQETKVQRVPLCTGSARCMMKDGKTSASPCLRGDPIIGLLTIEDLDSAAVISAGAQLNDHRDFALAHGTLAEVHMPVVKLILVIAGQLQLAHFLEKLKPISQYIESGPPYATKYHSVFAVCGTQNKSLSLMKAPSPCGIRL